MGKAPRENQEPLSGSSRVRGVTPGLRCTAARISGPNVERKAPGREAHPTPPGTGEEDLGRGETGEAPVPPLRLQLGTGPASARNGRQHTPEPRRTRARRTVTATSPRPAAGSARVPARGVPAHSSGPAARPLPPYLAGCGSGGSGAAPHVPVPHLPVRHAAVRPQRATAAAASWLRPHGPGSTGRKTDSVGGGRSGGGSKSRSAPHPPPRNRKWLHAAANSRLSQGGGAHSRGGPAARGKSGRGLEGGSRDYGPLTNLEEEEADPILPPGQSQARVKLVALSRGL